ncbi:hypothetical protein B0H12DRAFT_1135960 [Mycena haematopus]|nr:hypothetical protein B0H12DRAFT_1135960 [Mycena haematopus]
MNLKFLAANPTMDLPAELLYVEGVFRFVRACLSSRSCTFCAVLGGIPECHGRFSRYCTAGAGTTFGCVCSSRCSTPIRRCGRLLSRAIGYS